MFYKSSILAAVFVLLSIGNAIAADLSAIENFIAEQQVELTVNEPDQQLLETKNSASIAKARLIGLAPENLADAGDLKSPTNTELSPNKNSASIAKARLHNISSKESTNSKLIVPKLIDNSPTAPVTTLSASSELDHIKQWDLNKTITFKNLLHTPAEEQLSSSQKPSSNTRSIVQSSDRLPNSLIIIPPTTTPQTIEAQQPGTSKLIPQTVETKKPEISKPLSQTVETKKIEPLKPVVQTVDIKKPADSKPSSQNDEPKKWAVGVHTQFSTTGFIGVDAGYKFNPNLHARLGLNTVGFNVDYTSQGIDYKAKFTPTNVHLLGDYFPVGGGLRLTGGLIFQGNQFNATGTPNSSAIPTQISLGGTNYNITDVGAVSSEGSFSNSIAPYLGIGFGTPLSPGLGFNFDAGVMLAGSAKVKLRANIASSVDPTIQNNIRNSLTEQERRTNNDIGDFGLYPVLSVGFSYAF